MRLKSLNKNRLLRQILPSIFFFVLCVLYMLEERELILSLIAVGFSLLLLGNVFLQNIIISRILGIVFLLGSCYMLLAIYSDFVNGKATLGYLAGVFILLVSIAMSILLILGYKKKYT